MSHYRRVRLEGGDYFLTVVLANRKWRLLTDNIECLRQAFQKVMKVHPFRIDAAVILPEHLHCVLTLPMNDDNYSMRWRQIKSAFSRQLPLTEQRSLSRIKKVNEVFGNAVFGNMSFVMNKIINNILIISIIIPLSTVTLNKQLIGNIRLFIVP